MAEYRLLKVYPGIPSGEILAFDGNVYRGQTHTAFWVAKEVVENDPEQFELVV